MPCFRWPETRHDVNLVKEEAAHRPSKPLDWEEIAATLSEKFFSEERPVELKGSGCRERLERVLAKYKADDAKALKRFVGEVLCLYMSLHLLLTHVIHTCLHTCTNIHINIP